MPDDSTRHTNKLDANQKYHEHMRSLSKWNMTVKKFKDLSAGPASEVRAKGGNKFLGERYERLDRAALWMMWSMTILVTVLSLLLHGAGALVFIVIGVPAGLMLAVMISRMGGREWHQAVALIYVIALLFILLGLPS